MRILIAGAGGTIGRPLMQRLSTAGHELIGITRSARSAERIAALGGQPVVVNALDREALTTAVRLAQPQAAVHLLTALPKRGPLRGRDLRATNRLRREGTSNLVAACQAAGVERIVAESVVFAYGFGDLGLTLRDEEDRASSIESSLSLRQAHDAVLTLEEQVRLAAQGDTSTVVLRLGILYGAGVPSAEFMVKMLRWRMMGLPGGGKAVLPWVEISDAVGAFASALERGGGVYNIVDNESVTVRGFLDQLAHAFSTPPPYTVPYGLGKLTTPLAAHLFGRTALRLSNAKSKEQLGWSPAYPSYKSGIAHWAQHASGASAARDAGAST